MWRASLADRHAAVRQTDIASPQVHAEPLLMGAGGGGGGRHDGAAVELAGLEQGPAGGAHRQVDAGLGARACRRAITGRLSRPARSIWVQETVRWDIGLAST